MLKKLNSTLIIALCTGAGLVAFTFEKRHGAVSRIPDTVFYVAAAIICLLPVLYGLLRRKACCRAPNAA